MSATPTASLPRHRKRVKGIWMQVRDTELFQRYMDAAGFSQSALADAVGYDRQYIHMLYHGRRKSCGKRLAQLIEAELKVLPGTLFVAHKSPTTKRPVTRKGTAA